MGSGAFLVAVCRYLAGWLVKAWDNGDDHKAPTDSTLDKDLYARRLIAQSCLYGVDKNPFAVNLAKLSLWLCQALEQCELANRFLLRAIRAIGWFQAGDTLTRVNYRDLTPRSWAVCTRGCWSSIPSWSAPAAAGS
jgi:hypothetical protein